MLRSPTVRRGEHKSVPLLLVPWQHMRQVEYVKIVGYILWFCLINRVICIPCVICYEYPLCIQLSSQHRSRHPTDSATIGATVSRSCTNKSVVARAQEKRKVPLYTLYLAWKCLSKAKKRALLLRRHYLIYFFKSLMSTLCIVNITS